MDVSIAIGATHRFELREALLIYTEIAIAPSSPGTS
jgi:hypothetical protein